VSDKTPEAVHACHELIRFENLLLAYRGVRRSKGRSPDVARFALDLEKELLGLQRELRDDIVLGTAICT
jgi:hypothetical protein